MSLEKTYNIKSELVALGVFALCALASFIGVFLYIQGIGSEETGWGLIQTAYLIWLFAFSGFMTGLVLLLPTKLEYKGIIVGWVVTVAVSVLVSIHVPFNWDNAAGVGLYPTVVTIVLYIIGVCLMLVPNLKRLFDWSVENGYSTSRQQKIVLTGYGGVLLLGIAALGLYAYTQNTPGMLFDLRYIALILATPVIPLFLFSSMWLFPLDKYTKIVGVMSLLSSLATIVFIFFFYPEQWHTAQENIGYSAAIFFAYFLSVFGALGGVLSGAAKIYAEKSSTFSRIQRIGYNYDEERIRAAFRFPIGLMIMITLSSLLTALLLPVFREIALSFGWEFSYYPVRTRNVYEYSFAAISAVASWGLGSVVASKYIDCRNPWKLVSSEEKSFKFSHLAYGVIFGLSISVIIVGTLVGSGLASLSFAQDADLLTTLAHVIVKSVASLVGLAAVIYAFIGWWLQNFIEGLSGYIGKKGVIVIGIVTAGLFYVGLGFAVDTLTPILVINFLTLFAILAMVRIITDQLAGSIGIYVGLSIGIMIIFGLQFEHIMVVSLFETTLSGPEIYHGGNNGPFSGIVGLIGTLTTCVLTYDLAVTIGDEKISINIPKYTE